MFAVQAPDQCRLLLQSNPQLVYALFQALVVMNVVDSSVMQVGLSMDEGKELTQKLKLTWDI
jgi:hypothetical protein